MGLETQKSRRDRKWWYKIATMPEDRLPKQLFSQECNIKPEVGKGKRGVE